MYFLYGLYKCVLQFEGLAEKLCLCVQVSATQGMLIIWIFIQFPDIQNCLAIFMRKQTGNTAPEETITDWDPSILSFLLLSMARKNSKKQIKMEKA